MKRLQALEVVRQYYTKPVFNVKIGMCSNECTDVDFETAIEVFDRCDRHTTEHLEYVYIYASDFCKDAYEIDEALKLFNLGIGRHSLNLYEANNSQ